MSHGTVRLDERGRPSARVALDRPDVRNAFNDEMLEDLLEVFANIRDGPRGSCRSCSPAKGAYSVPAQMSTG